MQHTKKILFLILAILSFNIANAEKAATPNIIFILSDDLGYGDLSCFGQKKFQTPNLDKMADEGMKFTSFYAGSTVCAPSRCVLMTGKHTGRCYIRGNAPDPQLTSLRESDVTVAEVLKEKGYTTAMCGKWGMGELGDSGLPTRQGFDFFFGYLNHWHAHNYYPPFLVRNEVRDPLENKPHPDWLKMKEELLKKRSIHDGAGYSIERVDYAHDLIMKETLAWLDRSKDKPFFLYLAPTIPHANNEGTKLSGNGQEIPDYGRFADKDWTEPNKGQAAMIERMDRDIGRLLAKLKEYGIDDNTIVIFSSDNGHHKEGGNDPEFFDANGPLRGMKRDLYEGGIRVPTIARWPGKIAPGTISDHPAYFGDFLATACDIAGAKKPKNLQSISFLPSLTGADHKQKKHDCLYWEFYERGSAQAVRFGKWKALRTPMRTGKTQLYDLSVDLGEQNNIAEDNPHVVAYAEALMAREHQPTPNWAPKHKSSKGKTKVVEPGDGKMRF